MRFRQVDVFAERPLSGNGTVVFFGGVSRPAGELQRLTQEMRQFESVFVEPRKGAAEHSIDARIFSLVEELAFAGHPLLAAAAALHEGQADVERVQWEFHLGDRIVAIESSKSDRHYVVSMNQGRPTFGASPEPDLRRALLSALNIDESLLVGEPQVVSTGLRYLIVAVNAGLERARIVDRAFESLLIDAGAQYAYVVDVRKREGRHWENDGSMEDVATGSAAGPVGSWLVRNRLAEPTERIVLRQGRFVDRPSALFIQVHGGPEDIERVDVAGPVAMVAGGALDFELSAWGAETRRAHGEISEL
jgi:PhzF family phenazine biosynthesis protein